MPTIDRIRKRADFIKAKEAKNSVAAAGLVLQANKNPNINQDSLRVGFTATSTLGNAVKRNRIKRRLRALARQVMPNALPGHDYVIIGRTRTIDRDFTALIKDLKFALHNTNTHK